MNGSVSLLCYMSDRCDDGLFFRNNDTELVVCAAGVIPFSPWTNPEKVSVSSSDNIVIVDFISRKGFGGQSVCMGTGGLLCPAGWKNLFTVLDPVVEI